MAERDYVVPADPAQRRLRVRSTVRVLVLDDRDRVLLLKDSDPGTGDTWWTTPGGGIDPGESEVDAVVRELAEETGLKIAPDAILGPLARRHVWHGYSDQIVDQNDAFYAVRVPAFEVDTSGHTDDELVTLKGDRWWTAAELATATEVIWPVILTELWGLVDQPERWNLTLDDAEESTVLVGRP